MHSLEILHVNVARASLLSQGKPQRATRGWHKALPALTCSFEIISRARCPVRSPINAHLPRSSDPVCCHVARWALWTVQFWNHSKHCKGNTMLGIEKCPLPPVFVAQMDKPMKVKNKWTNGDLFFPQIKETHLETLKAIKYQRVTL